MSNTVHRQAGRWVPVVPGAVPPPRVRQSGTLSFCGCSDANCRVAVPAEVVAVPPRGPVLGKDYRPRCTTCGVHLSYIHGASLVDQIRADVDRMRADVDTRRDPPLKAARRARGGPFEAQGWSLRP